MTDLEQAERAYAEARKAKDEIENERRAARDAARAAVDAEFAERMEAAARVILEANHALMAARDATANHPWDGRKVFRMHDTNRGIWGAPRYERVEGIVETRRSGTQFPANTGNWRMPAIGTGFVRLLNAKGHTGLRWEELRYDGYWQLADEPAPEGA